MKSNLLIAETNKIPKSSRELLTTLTMSQSESLRRQEKVSRTQRKLKKAIKPFYWSPLRKSSLICSDGSSVGSSNPLQPNKKVIVITMDKMPR